MGTGTRKLSRQITANPVLVIEHLR